MTVADTLRMSVEFKFGGYWVKLDGIEWWGVTFEDAFDGLVRQRLAPGLPRT